MAYKRIRVWDGSEWQQVGSEVPGVVDASGRGTVTLTAGAGSTALSFGTVVFTFIPLVFVQVTGVNNATIRVVADTVGFTIYATGTGTDVITFDWFAVQTDFA